MYFSNSLMYLRPTRYRNGLLRAAVSAAAALPVLACTACRRRFRGQDGFVRCCVPAFAMPKSKPQNTRQRKSRKSEY